MMSVALGCQNTEIWLLPGTSAKFGATGAEGSRNLASKTDCAANPLPTRLPGTERTVYCEIASAGSAGQGALSQPAATSMGRTTSPPQPGCCEGTPGGLSEPRVINGVLTVAAANMAATMMTDCPGSSRNGPEAAKRRTSERAGGR